MKKAKTTDCKIVISAKCADRWSHHIVSANGSAHSHYDGYVPSFMPGQHFGDYIELEINPYTGRILNWKTWKRAKKLKSTKSKMGVK
jgi:hypothetical protein